MTDKLTGYASIGELIDWAMAQLNIMKPRDQLSDGEIRQLVRWIGLCAVDSILVEGEPIPGRIGIGLMLTITLLEFSQFYQRHQLAQFN
jgi:hypothetical protein